jgi:uncharacterized RDD family membrane protein YckC
MPKLKDKKELKARLNKFALAFAICTSCLVVLFCLLLLALTLITLPLLLEPYLFFSAALTIVGISISYAWSQSFSDL